MNIQAVLDFDNQKFGELTPKERVKRIAYIHYLLTDNSTFNLKDLTMLFNSNNLVSPNISRELSTICTGKSREIFKTKNGFVLERGFIKLMDEKFAVKYTKEISIQFQEQLDRVKQPIQKEFLQDAFSCFNAKLYRPTILMTWIVVMDVLYEYVLSHYLISFNAELIKTNKKIIIQKKGDFEDLKESTFIELLRASSVISKEQKKILDEKLSVRNSAAHPNSTSFKEAKTVTFVEELFNDIVKDFLI